MSTDRVITSRASALDAWGVPLLAALLAADGASPGGLRPQDVRFYFLLFTNWMGDDHLRPGADLDPTQVRRALQRLAGDGLATGGEGRPPLWSLTSPGVVRLVDALTDPTEPRRFEEVLLLATIATSYVDLIATRVRGGEARRVRHRLDGRAILRAERRRLEDALRDMEARAAIGPRISAAARRAKQEGEDPIAAVEELFVGGGVPYQLHPMRPLREVLASLPEGLRRYEIEGAAEHRARRLFSPLAEVIRAHIAVLDRLEAERGP